MSSLRDDETCFQCKHCSESFKREDHLRRHELSHGFPRFLCEHPDCGMRFHRKDVLQRHKLVHQPHPSKKRRKPRRGVLPRGPIQAGNLNSGDSPVAEAAQDPLTSFAPSSQDTAANISNLPSLSAGTPGSVSSLVLEPFNLATEYNLGLEDLNHDFPILDVDIGRFQAPVWQNATTPSFDFNFMPQHNPFSQYQPVSSNADVQLLQTGVLPPTAPTLGTPTCPMTTEEMRICYSKFRRMFLPRIPFLHHLTCEAESLYSALGLSMITVGAMYIKEFRQKAPHMYRLALEALKQPCHSADRLLRNTQASILLIDFAAWYGDAELRQWAIREQHVLSQHKKAEEFLALIPPLDYDCWNHWIFREETKRTMFAFFVTSVIIATFHPVASPMVPPCLDLTLPCPETVWDATNEDEWRAQVDSLGLRGKKEINFAEASFAMLTQDTTHATDYELATIFGQYILLCVIVDAFNLAIRLPTNYYSVDAWRRKDMTQFTPAIDIEGALNLWVDLWWASPEFLWDPNVPANARIEAISLHQHTTVRLYKNRDFSKDRSEERYKPIHTATESFVSMSKNGFREVATYACHILSVCCYYIAVELAKTMVDWLSYVASPEYGPLTKRDIEIIARLRQGVRRNNQGLQTTTPTPRDALGMVPLPKADREHDTGLEELLRQLTHQLNIQLGGEDWKIWNMGEGEGPFSSA